MLRRLLLPLCLALLTACPGPLADDPPRRLLPGDAVLAPWSREAANKLYLGKVEQQYGKLVGIRYPRGTLGWTLVGQVVPPGLPEPDPGDPPSATAGGRVLAPPLVSGTPLTRGTVVEVYGKLALVDYDAGDLGWTEGAALRPLAPEEESVESPPSSGPPVEVGARVTATLAGGKPEAARVAQVHGRLVYLYFERGPQAWVEAGSLVPPAGAAPEPPRAATLARGTTVLAPAPGGSGTVPARVLDCYGKLVRLAFEGGEEGWVRAWELTRER